MKKIKMQTVAFIMNDDEQYQRSNFGVLEQIAKTFNGQFTKANSPKLLEKTLVEEFIDIEFMYKEK